MQFFSSSFNSAEGRWGESPVPSSGVMAVSGYAAERQIFLGTEKSVSKVMARRSPWRDSLISLGVK